MLRSMTSPVHYTRPLLTHWARAFDVPVSLAEAIVSVESAGNTYAHRFEPHYRYLWNVQTNQPFRLDAYEAKAKKPPSNFPAPAGLTAASEFVAQQTSWGLMQLMGAVAREHGFSGPLPSLTEASKGLEFGCRYLQVLAHRHQERHGWAGVIRAYNTGRATETIAGQRYLQKIIDAGFNPAEAT